MSPSGATWVLEDRLGVLVTSRGVPTMRRLLVKHPREHADFLRERIDGRIGP